MQETYREIMDHIVITEEMRGRILNRLRESPVPATSRARRFPTLRQVISAAACFIILLAGTLATAQHFSSPEQPLPDTGNVGNTLPSFREVPSLQELSQAVGFPVEGLSELPFFVTDTIYTAFKEGTAEIRYMGADNSAIYRKTAGSEDPSGDYTQYPSEITLKVGDLSVTLKGENGLFSLALWQDDTYSYSVRISLPVSESDWSSMLTQ